MTIVYASRCLCGCTYTYGVLCDSTRGIEINVEPQGGAIRAEIVKLPKGLVR